MLNLFLDLRKINEKYYFNLEMMLNLFHDLRNINFNDEQTLNLIFDNEKYYFNLRMMLNLFLDLRNINFNDEQMLNFKCFTVNNINFTNIKEFIHCLSPIGYNWP
jgi:hypothetical protein